MPPIVIAVIIFGMLIFVHEAGHFLAAKRAGIDVLEFGIGFGPKLLSFQRRETTYTLRALPLGGFVRMAGTDPDDLDNEAGFAKKSVPKRALVIVAGAAMNLILAMVMFGMLISITGIPTGEMSNEPEIGEIIIGDRADQGGLLPGDRVVTINGEPIENWTELVQAISSNPEMPLETVVLRDGNEVELTVTPRLHDQEDRGWIGITAVYLVRPAGLGESILFGIQQTFYVAGLILSALYQMITGQMPADVSGPIAITRIIGRAARLGFPYLLNLAAIININIGLFNLIPIPALDGSRLMFLGLEGIRGKPLDQDKENLFHMVGFALLMLLAIVVAYRDIINIGSF
jgi:regulator of sigma E protease